MREILEQPLDEGSPLSKDWALGKKHVFLSEGTRQHLEKLRADRRNYFATLIQSVWRCRSARKKWPFLRQSLQQARQHQMPPTQGHQTPGAQVTQMSGHSRPKSSRPRPQPISGTPPPDTAGSAAPFTLNMRDRPLPPIKGQELEPSFVNGHGKIEAGRFNGNHPQQQHDRCDMKTIQNTCALFGLDLVSYI